MRIDQRKSNASPGNWAGVMPTVLFVLILLTQPLGTYGSEPREMHSAAITRIAVDRSERILASVSEDKSLKIWELKTGRLIRTVHPPAGDGDVGKLYAVAISPDGKTIACSGYTGKKKPTSFDGQTYYEYEIYLYDTETGNLLRTLDVPVIVDHLTYSPKGDLLLATQSDKPGFTIKRPENDSTREKAVLVFKVGSYDQIDVDDQYSNYWTAVGDF